jgi:beta-lactamase class A
MLLYLLLSFLLSPSDRREALEARIRSIAQTAGGTVGVSVLHVESGRGASLRANESFPMASIFKLPVAIELLRRVDRGTVRLDQKIALTAGDMRVGHSPIAERAPSGGITMSIGELLESMLVDSDNTAADVLLPLAGGPEIIRAQLEEAGFADIRVDRSEAELALDFFGVDPVPPRASWSLVTFRRLVDAVPPARRREAAVRFLADPRDTATPDAMAKLLVSIERRDRLSPESAARLLALMVRTRTGAARIKGLLPAGTEVAHRTGLCGDCEGINACTNDAGIVTLPGRVGHLAIAVFVRGSDRDLGERETAIARIARAAYDHWMR